MSSYLPFVIVGLTSGAVYGLAGTGLVLTYKTSGIFNFAYGAIAALLVFAFYFLATVHGVPWPIAALVCLGVVAPISGLGLEYLARILEPVSATIKVVSMVGLILVAEGIGLLWHGASPPTVPYYLPQSTVRLLGVNITWQEIIVFAISLVASTVLYWFFRFVRLGIAMRGVVDNPELLSMTGDSPIRVRRWAWVIGTVFAGLAGLLLAPSQLLDSDSLTLLIFAAFGAAALGYFSNLPLTFAGGLLIGVAGAFAAKFAATVTWMAGLPPALPFIFLFVVLILTPRARLVEQRVVKAVQIHRSYQAPIRIRLGAGTIAVAVVAVLPLVVGTHLSLWSAALIDIILFLSLGLLVRQSGQISLCHLAFAAVGASSFGHFSSGLGLPWLVALALAVVIAIPIGAIIAIPAIRLSGVFLALATLGFGIVLEQLFYNSSLMFGASSLGVAAPRPDVSIFGWNLSTDRGFYYLLLVIALLVIAVLTAIRQGRLGRILGALSDSPVALEAHGAASNVSRVLVFSISAAMASLAGALTAMLYHYGVGSYFTSFASLTLVVLVVIVTVGDPWYAVVAALGYTVVAGYVSWPHVNTYLELLFGVSATGAALFVTKGGAPVALQRFLDRIGGRPGAASQATSAPAGGVTVEPGLAGAGATDVGTVTAPRGVRPTWLGSGGMTADGLSVHFGGIKALQSVDLRVPSARITGLIGPNGAGKSTMLNACTGLVRPTAGSISLHGVDVSRYSPSRRSRSGLGRTFQRAALFDSLTVRQNVDLGRESSLAGGNPLTQLVGSRSSRVLVAAAADEAIELTGIAHLGDVQCGLLSAGQKRMVELARVLAGPFNTLLLDEPSSGLDVSETETFGSALLRVMDERDMAICLVEHDMALVRQICAYVYVLDFGRLVFEGTVEDMLASSVVRAAYLGTDGVEVSPTLGGSVEADRFEPVPGPSRE